MTEAVKVAKKSTKPRKSVAKNGSEPKVPTHTPAHEEIARLAYRFWEERGYKHGHAEKDWDRAKRELQTP